MEAIVEIKLKKGFRANGGCVFKDWEEEGNCNIKWSESGGDGNDLHCNSNCPLIKHGKITVEIEK